jgi:LysR family transcriptional regulator, carnitine catabolism transcriptional activator
MSEDATPSGNLTIRQLEIFLVASRSESFSAAAKKLAISQPTLSSAVARIEQQLGVTLFDRTTRRVVLTSAGGRLAVAAADLVRIYHSSISNLRAAPENSPRIRLSVSPTLGAVVAPAAIAAFRETHPDFEVTLHDVDRQDAITLLTDRMTDFAIMNDAPTLADLEREVIGDTWFDVVVASTSPLASLSSVRWKDLAGTPLILAGSLQRRGYLQSVWENAGYQFQPRYEVNELTTGLGLAAAGLGYVLLPHSYLSRPLDRGLAAVRLNSPAMARPLELLFLKASPPSDAMREFLAIFRAEFAAPGG